MNDKGWIKLHRKILDCWIWQEKPYDKARAWVDLLLLAMHREKKLLIDNEIVIVERGSFVTSTVKLANRWGWSRCKVMRYLELLESEQMLNTKRTPKGTLVTIVKYEDYQIADMADDTTLDTTLDTPNDTTLDTPNDTTLDTPNETADETQKKNIKNIKNDKNNNMSSLADIKIIVEYLNKVCGTKYRHSTKSTQSHINARLTEGYTVDDFKAVIDKKAKEWKGTEHEKYLCPDTLFGTKFEKYINQKIVNGKKLSNSFNSFSEQRDYDYKELEKELFGG